VLYPLLYHLRSKKKHEEQQTRVSHELIDIPKVSFTIDGWTSPFQDSFVCVTAHWISNTWAFREIVLGFEPLTGKHTSQALLDVFISVIERFGLQRKIHAITSDNGSNVKGMMELLEIHTINNDDSWYVQYSIQHWFIFYWTS